MVRKNKKKNKYMSNTKPLLFLIEWMDHVGFEDGGWKPLSAVHDLLNPIKVSSVGWVLAETDDHITVIPTMVRNGDCCGAMSILKSDIIKSTKLSQHDKTDWKEFNIE